MSYLTFASKDSLSDTRQTISFFRTYGCKRAKSSLIVKLNFFHGEPVSHYIETLEEVWSVVTNVWLSLKNLGRHGPARESSVDKGRVNLIGIRGLKMDEIYF